MSLLSLPPGGAGTVLSAPVNVTVCPLLEGLGEEATAVVVFALPIENVRPTSVAAVKLLSPACEAVIVPEPAPVIWTLLPLIVQLPEALKLTARPEVEVALTVKSGSPKVLLESGSKVIVWDAFCAVTASVA